MRSLSIGRWLLLAWGIMHVLAGSMNGLALWQDRVKFFQSLGIPSDALSQAPELLTLTVGISAVWCGCLIGLGILAIFLANGPYREGRSWAWWAAVGGFGVPDVGAILFWWIACPPMPLPLLLGAGVALFLGSVIIPSKFFLRGEGNG